MQSISDLAGAAGNNAASQTNAGLRPDFVASGVFGRGSLDFSGSPNDLLIIGNTGAINTSVHDERAIAISFRTGSDVTTTQVLYEEGAQVNGITAYIQNGRFYWSIHRNNGAQTAFVSTPIAANTDFTASFDFSAPTNTVRGYLNGNLFGTTAGIGANLPSHSGGIGLGGVNNLIRLHDGSTVGTGNGFQGQIADFILYNESFTDADHASLDGYLQGTVPSAAGFSDEQLQFKVDGTDGELLSYNLAKTDLMLVDLSGINIRTAATANTANAVLRAANDFIAEERANIGALLSQLEFANSQVGTFTENTLSANSVIADTDLAEESTNAINRLTQNQLTISVLTFANQSTELLLDILSPPDTAQA